MEGTEEQPTMLVVIKTPTARVQCKKFMGIVEGKSRLCFNHAAVVLHWGDVGIELRLCATCYRRACPELPALETLMAELLRSGKYEWTAEELFG